MGCETVTCGWVETAILWSVEGFAKMMDWKERGSLSSCCILEPCSLGTHAAPCLSLTCQPQKAAPESPGAPLHLASSSCPGTWSMHVGVSIMGLWSLVASSGYKRICSVFLPLLVLPNHSSGGFDVISALSSRVQAPSSIFVQFLGLNP